MERLIGYDFLGAEHPKFRLKAAVRFTPKGSPLGGLDTTFGSDFSRLRTLLTDIRPSFYRSHILNTTCVRGRNCGSYESFAGHTIASLDAAIKKKNPQLLRRFEARIDAFRVLSLSFTGTEFLISPALEHNLSPAAWEVLADAALGVWGTVRLVNSPAGGVPFKPYRGAWYESHTNPQRPYQPTNSQIVSTDGTDIRDIADSKRWLAATAGSYITFVWSMLYNGRDDGPFVDPRRRTAWPIPSQFRNIVELVS